eukprot:8846647-Ditylum_brightwellii.AAC.1
MERYWCCPPSSDIMLPQHQRQNWWPYFTTSARQSPPHHIRGNGTPPTTNTSHHRQQHHQWAYHWGHDAQEAQGSGHALPLAEVLHGTEKVQHQVEAGGGEQGTLPQQAPPLFFKCISTATCNMS